MGQIFGSEKSCQDTIIEPNFVLLQKNGQKYSLESMSALKALFRAYFKTKICLTLGPESMSALFRAYFKTQNFQQFSPEFIFINALKALFRAYSKTKMVKN